MRCSEHDSTNLFAMIYRICEFLISSVKLLQLNKYFWCGSWPGTTSGLATVSVCVAATCTVELKLV
jgi:hypothetical protein